MTQTLTPPLPASRPARREAPGRPRERDAPGLAVLALPARQIPLAGYLLRHGPALTLVESVPDPVPVSAAAVGAWVLPSDLERLEDARRAAAERALEATANAGFAIHAVETLAREQLRARLGNVDGADVTCVVVAGRGARAVRRLARAAGAPVLVFPDDAAPAGGPAVLEAADVGRTAPAAARALATEEAVVVAGSSPAQGAALAHSAAHPALVPRLDELAHRMRREALDEATERAERAALVAEEYGLRPRPAVSFEPDAAVRVAKVREGILVLTDSGGLRVPRLLRAALADRRPVLLVPAGRSGSGAHPTTPGLGA